MEGNWTFSCLRCPNMLPFFSTHTPHSHPAWFQSQSQKDRALIMQNQTVHYAMELQEDTKGRRCRGLRWLGWERERAKSSQMDNRRTFCNGFSWAQQVRAPERMGSMGSFCPRSSTLGVCRWVCTPPIWGHTWRSHHSCWVFCFYHFPLLYSQLPAPATIE